MTKKEYLVSFTVSRIYEAEENESKEEIKELAEIDFYDDARHGGLNPEIKIKQVKQQ